MSAYFKPYEGTRPYLFVSYAHLDSALVLATIEPLHDEAWRIWYDEGIPAGSDWPRNIETHLQACETVLFFRSAHSLASPNCLAEIRAAHALGKRVLRIDLDEAEPPEEWRDLISACDLVSSVRQTTSHTDAIRSAEGLAQTFVAQDGEMEGDARTTGGRSLWTLAVIASASLLVAALVALVGLATGQLDPQALVAQDLPQEADVPQEQAEQAEQTPVDLNAYGDLFDSYVSFPDAQQERAVRAALGTSDGQVPSERLLEIDSLCFAGNLTPKDLSAVSFEADGTCLVNGVPVGQGMVSDLSLISKMGALKELGLVCQPLDDLKPLSGLPSLRELSLAGSPLRDLSPITSLPSLEVLHLEHTAIHDLAPLTASTTLRRVTVSADMVPLSIDPHATYDVILVR